MKTVLLLTDVNFWEKYSGNRSRIYALVKYLAPRVKLTVVNNGPAPEGIENNLSTQFGAEFFVLEKKRYLSSNGYGRKLKTLLKGRQFDVTIIEYLHSSYFINFLNGETRLVLDAHDLISQRAAEFAQFGYAGEIYEISEETEKEILSVYDQVMVLCPEDAALVEAATGAGRALLCPHPVEAQQYPINPEVKNIAFTGSAYLPNKDGMDWFLQNCWPQIAAKYDVQLNIYGAICSSLDVTGLQRVTLKGFVPDVEEIYREADIVINPVRFGAGIKIKTIEALAYGRPLLTTPHGARGIAGNEDAILLVADDAGDFIARLSNLIEDALLRQRLSATALQYAEKRLTAEHCFKPLIDTIYE